MACKVPLLLNGCQSSRVKTGKTGRRPFRMKQLALLALKDPWALSSPKILAAHLKISYANAKMMLSRFAKLCRGGNKICPECLSDLIFQMDDSLQELCCNGCGFVSEDQMPQYRADSQHEVQSEIWQKGTVMNKRELKQIAPNLKGIFSNDKQEQLAKKVRNELEQILKAHSFDVSSTSFLYRQALTSAKDLFPFEKGSMLIFKAVLYTLLRNASCNPRFYSPVLEYLMAGPYCKARRKSRSAN